MEDDLKTMKVEYFNNHWSDLPQILNLLLWDQAKNKSAWYEDDLQWKTTSKYKKLNISATTDWIVLKFYTKAQETKPN